ncbi:MAG: 3'-5' exonuclease [Planctomycetaceae bacterium]
MPDNYRSQRALVQLVGQLFVPVFGKEAIQNPKKPASSKGVERWILESENQPQDADALACGISKLHSEGIRFGEMAVPERVNRRLNGLARALDSLGIPYLLDSPGLLATREGVLVLAGLRLVSDRSDSLAAATILHILGDPNLETPEWLHERLTAIQATPPTDDTTEPSEFVMPWNGDARLSALERIDRRTLAPLLVVQQVIETLEVPSLVQKWGEPARRCSNSMEGDVGFAPATYRRRPRHHRPQERAASAGTLRRQGGQLFGATFRVSRDDPQRGPVDPLNLDSLPIGRSGRGIRAAR